MNCPFCNTSTGFFKAESSRQEIYYDWKGDETSRSEPEVIYSGTRMHCLECRGDVTSLVNNLNKMKPRSRRLTTGKFVTRHDLIVAVRYMRNEGGFALSQIADHCGVSKSTVSKITSAWRASP